MSDVLAKPMATPGSTLSSSRISRTAAGRPGLLPSRWRETRIKGARPAYARQLKQMIHAFLDNGALANVRAVEVLATKFDHVVGQRHGDKKGRQDRGPKNQGNYPS